MFQSLNMHMSKLDRDRQITIYLPDDYDMSEQRYPVLYIQDGQNAFFDEESYSGISWGFADYVIENELDIIMVAIPCNEEGYKRNDEYGPWIISDELTLLETGQTEIPNGGEGQDYVDWMVYELKPYIDTHYRTIEDDTGIVGSSMGGVIAAYAGLVYPEVFNKCACLSTAFWFYMYEFDDLIDQYDYHGQRFYMDLGEFEGCGDEELDQMYIETNDYIYQRLLEKDMILEYRFFEDTVHNESEWRKRVPIFMEFLYVEDENV